MIDYTDSDLDGPQIFEDLVFSFETLSHRFRELAFLNRGVTVVLEDRRPEKERRQEFLTRAARAERERIERDLD